MRNLVSIRKVDDIQPIPDADNIEVATIGGWKCVIKKGELEVGKDCIYFEVDSILPADDPRFAFLENSKFRVKTIRLRGQVSQGLAMPLSILTPSEKQQLECGVSLENIFKVQKYEVPLPMGGGQIGKFPSFIPKTDQERIQNLESEEIKNLTYRKFEITEKLDGTSCTMYFHDGHFGICSRNWELNQEVESVYTSMAKKYSMEDTLSDVGLSLAVQGEIIGPGIQGNKYELSAHDFYVFDIYDITYNEYLSPEQVQEICEYNNWNHVPIVNDDLKDFDFTFIACEKALELAEGKSKLNPKTEREGLVFKMQGFTFKVISNKFLLKEK